MAKLPGRRSKTPLMTEEQRAAETKFGRCPRGHALPNRTNRGNCTPIFCAGSTPGAKKERKKRDEPKEIQRTGPGVLATDDDAGNDDADANVLAESTRRITQAATRHKARMQYLKVPAFADPKDRDAWIEAKKKELVPLALADVEYAIKLGDTQEREKARREILDMTGHGKKEQAAGQSQPLILITGLAEGGLPWVRRVGVDGKEMPASLMTVNGAADEKK